MHMDVVSEGVSLVLSNKLLFMLNCLNGHGDTDFRKRLCRLRLCPVIYLPASDCRSFSMVKNKTAAVNTGSKNPL